jgi:hypothetical protein
MPTADYAPPLAAEGVGAAEEAGEAVRKPALAWVVEVEAAEAAPELEQVSALAWGWASGQQ